MIFKRSFITDSSSRDRRSGLNRRWIKAPYQGVERRSGKDRRGDLSPSEATAEAVSDAERTESLEKLLLSASVRLEALVRLLMQKGILTHEELADMLRIMHSEYQNQQLRPD
jgi:hypothetical protein